MNRFPSIRKNSEYQAVYKKGDSKAAGCLVMYKKPNDLSINRIGICAGRKIGNSIVRHTFARKIREIFRLNNSKTVNGYDIVIVARNQAGKQEYHKIENDYLKLLSYHGLLADDELIHKHLPEKELGSV